MHRFLCSEQITDTNIFSMFQRILLLLAVTNCFIACNRPLARFSYSGEPKAPAPVQFKNESEKAERYEWNFGDGNTSTEAAPTHEYKSSGHYTVELKAIQGKKVKTTTKEVTVKAPDKCLVEIETDFGNMLVELFDSTPKHQENFVKLTEQHYYDSLMFHRVINGFMIQGGDPDSKRAKPNQGLGSGGPNYTIQAEFADTLIHTKGVLAAARQGDQVNPQKRSSGSQFYIVHGRPVNAQTLDQLEAQKGKRYSTAQRQAYLEVGGAPFLDWEYTVFGRVIKGLEVIDEIAATQTDPRDRPVKDVRMKIRLIK